LWCSAGALRLRRRALRAEALGIRLAEIEVGVEGHGLPTQLFLKQTG